MANLDVEMRVRVSLISFSSYVFDSLSGPQDDFPAGSTYLVIDTNVLIDQLAVIKRLSEDVEAHSIPIVIVIPNVVLTELDG